jgi:DNA repair exonuclease SbcCD nuclease subunit
MKFLFFTDTHIKGTNPRNRKDNFFETLKSKFTEIKNIAKEENVDYIIHGGDWFDRPDISPSIVREFAKIIRDFNRPVYSVAGNHDIYGHNPSTIKRTMLGLLEGIGLVNLINFDESVILNKDGIKVQLKGSPYRYDIDGEYFKKYYVLKKDKEFDYLINIVHGMLLKKPFFEGIQYTLVEDILKTEADITLAGHYHSGFGIEKKENKYFINPGSIIRITNTLSEMKRKPKIIIIDLEETIKIREILLKSALDGEEVLDRTILEKEDDKNNKLKNFYKSVINTDGYEKIDIGKIIDTIAYNQNIDKNVKEEAIKRIEIANDEINSKGEEE